MPSRSPGSGWVATVVPSPWGCRVGGGWVLVGGGEAAGGMNEFTPGSVAPVSTNSVPLGDRTLRSSNTPAPAAAMSSTTSTAINHVRLDPVAGGGVSVARCGAPGVDGRTGAAPVGASWVAWWWMGAARRSDRDNGCPGTVGPGPASGIVVGPRAARAHSTALAYR